MSLYNFTQFDGLTPADISTFATERFNDLIRNPVRLGERVLPFVRRDEWTEEVGRVSFRPVASAIIGPDSPLPRGPLGTHSQKQYDILKGGMKYGLNESEIRKLREVFFPGANISPQQIFRSRPYQLANALVTAYLDRAEQMRWEALSTGEYVIPGSPSVAIDYGFDPTHQITLAGGDTWDTTASADGLGDLEAWDAILFDELGVHSVATYMSTKQLNNLLAQDATKTKLAAAGYAGIGGQVAANANQLTMDFYADQVNAYLARREIGPIILYDRKFNDFDFRGASQPALTRFLGENHFVMVAPTPLDGGDGFPGGTAVGYTVDGPVVENNFQPGLYVWMTEIDEPYEAFVKSVFWTLPIIGDPRTVVSGTVQ